ncbi:MAG: hypothetical protein NVS2B14_16030 [Chamaesiphon sp.]
MSVASSELCLPEDGFKTPDPDESNPVDFNVAVVDLDVVVATEPDSTFRS